MSSIAVAWPTARMVRCPYCRHDNRAVCRQPISHETLERCSACQGVFVVRFDVAVQGRVLTVEGELDRTADEAAERLELQRQRAR